MHIVLFLCVTALDSLRRTKWRSLLTISSIIIGIAAVIATLGVGRGVQQKMLDRINSFGTNALYVHAGATGQTGATTATKKQKATYLSSSDVAFFREHPGLSARISGVVHTKDQLCVFQNKRIMAEVTAVEPEYLAMSKLTLAKGRGLLPSDLAHNTNVAILGSRAAQELFKHRSGIDEMITINNAQFRVVGILEEAENSSTFRDRNLSLYVPLTTGRRLFTTLPEQFVHSILISLASDENSTLAERMVRRIMRARHKLAIKDPDDFTIWNQSSMAQAAQESYQMMNIFLLIIASLSLLVGGIGVSNIMLVSVSERTREIGIRMALGASPFMIRLQFLIESMLLCFFGGILGVVFGIAIPHAIGQLLGWRVIITVHSVVASVVVTMLVGLLFGYLPAQRAAKLAIVDALNDQ